jgi:hypothetical protein
MNQNKYIVILLTILVAALLSINTAHSKTFYKWIDKRGHTHITDYPPPEGEAIKIEEFEAEEREESLQEKIQSLMESGGMDTGDVELTPEELFQLSEGEFPFQLSEPMLQMLSVFGTALSIISFALSLLMNLMLALCIYLIARKTGVSYAWMAWVPILNMFPLFGAAGYRWYVGLLVILVPVVALIPGFFIPPLMVIITIAVAIGLFVFFINLWMRICENLATSKWLGLLIIVPFVNLFLPPYLAFKKEPALEGVRKLRPALITLIVFVVLVLVYTFAAPHFMPQQFSQPLSHESAPFQNRTYDEEN